VGVRFGTVPPRGEVRDIFFAWLRLHRPDLIPYYQDLYKRGAYAPSEVRNRHAELARLERRRPKRGLRAPPKPLPSNSLKKSQQLLKRRLTPQPPPQLTLPGSRPPTCR